MKTEIQVSYSELRRFYCEVCSYISQHSGIKIEDLHQYFLLPNDDSNLMYFLELYAQEFEVDFRRFNWDNEKKREITGMRKKINDFFSIYTGPFRFSHDLFSILRQKKPEKTDGPFYKEHGGTVEISVGDLIASAICKSWTPRDEIRFVF